MTHRAITETASGIRPAMGAHLMEYAAVGHVVSPRRGTHTRGIGWFGARPNRIAGEDRCERVSRLPPL
jgi:hypothetical protein